MSVIQVKNACKTYGSKDELKVEALKSATFSVEKGEFVCIIGTSGSGKSTLLHLLAGVDQATSGSIIVNNKDVTKLSQEELSVFRRTEVGIIYQFFNLVPVLTARENIELPLMLSDQPVPKDYFEEIVQMLDIEDRLDFYPSKLSGGEQQRVAIARALIHRPSILLADEPTGNLNSQLAKEIMEFLVLACKKFNQTIIMITHDLKLAQYADRIIEIQDGELIEDHKKHKHPPKNEQPKQTASRKTEGLNPKSGNYIIDETRWMMAMKDLYQKDLNAQTNSEKSPLTKEAAYYFKMFKESIAAFKEDHLLIFINLDKEKATQVFRRKEDLLAFIDGLDKKQMMTLKRKNQLLSYLAGD